MRARTALVASALGLAAALGGCRSDPAPSATAPPAPAGSHFVGRTAGGLGASVDFGGFDEVSRAVRRALAERGEEAHVAIASLVNDGPEPLAVPAFAAIDRLGERHALATAGPALLGLPGPLARRARAALEEPATVPSQGSAVVYLVLRGLAPGDLRELRMRVPGGRPAALERRGG